MLAALLVFLLSDSIAALRTHTTQAQYQKACPRVPTALLPSLSNTSKPIKQQERSAAELKSYLANLPHSRVCWTSQDRVAALSALVVPKLKLAFCYIPKVACTNFKDLFNNLNGLPQRFQGYGHHYLASSRKTLKIPEENISRANGWKFATFTRDPALRYLSAFGSTCVPVSNVGIFGHFEHFMGCCGPRMRKNNIPRSQMVRAFEERVMSDLRHGAPKKDDHWASQEVILRQCGWQWFNPESVDFIGTLNGDVNAQVKQMLEMVRYKNDTLVDKHFPPDDIAGHRSPIHLPPEEFYKSGAVLRAVKQLYEEDYRSIPNVGCSFTYPAFDNLTSQQM